MISPYKKVPARISGRDLGLGLVEVFLFGGFGSFGAVAEIFGQDLFAAMVLVLQAILDAAGEVDGLRFDVVLIDGGLGLADEGQEVDHVHGRLEAGGSLFLGYEVFENQEADRFAGHLEFLGGGFDGLDDIDVIGGLVEGFGQVLDVRGDDLAEIRDDRREEVVEQGAGFLAEFCEGNLDSILGKKVAIFLDLGFGEFGVSGFLLDLLEDGFEDTFHLGAIERAGHAVQADEANGLDADLSETIGLEVIGLDADRGLEGFATNLKLEIGIGQGDADGLGMATLDIMGGIDFEHLGVGIVENVLEGVDGALEDFTDLGDEVGGIDRIDHDGLAFGHSATGLKDVSDEILAVGLAVEDMGGFFGVAIPVEDEAFIEFDGVFLGQGEGNSDEGAETLERDAFGGSLEVEAEGDFVVREDEFLVAGGQGEIAESGGEVVVRGDFGCGELGEVFVGDSEFGAILREGDDFALGAANVHGGFEDRVGVVLGGWGFGVDGDGVGFGGHV